MGRRRVTIGRGGGCRRLRDGLSGGDLGGAVRVRVRVGLGLGFRVGLGLGLAFLYLGDTVARAHEAILYAADFDVRHLRPIQRAVAG